MEMLQGTLQPIAEAMHRCATSMQNMDGNVANIEQHQQEHGNRKGKFEEQQKALEKRQDDLQEQATARVSQTEDNKVKIKEVGSKLVEDQKELVKI